MDDVPAVQQD